MSQSKRLQELRATRAQIGSDLRRLVDENPGDKWTADCTANYDNALQGIDKIDAEIGRIEKALKVADAVSASLDQRAGDASISDQRAQDQAESEMAVFRNWMRDGMQNLTPEQQVIARQRMAPVQGAGVGTGAAGGVSVFGGSGGAGPQL